jgi:hypothetical protein
MDSGEGEMEWCEIDTKKMIIIILELTNKYD